MVQIAYIGDRSPIRIKVGNAYFENWKRGEIREVIGPAAEILLAKKGEYEAVGKDFKKEEKKKEEKKEDSSPNFDLDGDGDFDSDDLTLAAKTMAAGRKKKKY